MIDPDRQRHDLSGEAVEASLDGVLGAPAPRRSARSALALMGFGGLLGSIVTWGWIAYSNPGAVFLPAWAAEIGPQVEVKALRAGAGARPNPDDVVLVNYSMGIEGSEKQIDSGQQVPMPLDQVIQGFRDAIVQMQKGGKYRVWIPSRFGYGDRAAGPIPANSNLWFEVELIDFRTRAEIEAAQRAQGGEQVPGSAAKQE